VTQYSDESLKNTPKSSQDESPNIIEGKEVAYYSALVQAWIQTRMEMDKTLVILSSGGIGLLVTLLTTIGIEYQWELIPYAGAFVGFLITITLCIIIFKSNSVYIEKELSSEDKKPNLRRYDLAVQCAFIFAVICAIAIGLIATLH
jgi:hypothetical protein